MDFQFIETLLELPEFRVIGQVIRPHEFDCILNAETLISSALTVRGAAPGSKRVESDVSAICPFWIVRSPCGCISDGLKCSDCHHRPWETK